MTFTKDQLITIAWRLDMQSQSRSFTSTDGGALLHAVREEIYRLENGPFTFAEARASGKPYRRLAWTESYRGNEWATHVYVDQEETYFANAEGIAIAAFDEESAVATDYVLHA